MSTSSYRTPKALKAAVLILAVCMAAAILAVDVLKLTEPESSTPPPKTNSTTGQLTSSKPDTTSRCAVILNLVPHPLPANGKEVERWMADVYFRDNPLQPVLSENYYMLKVGKAYRVTIEKKKTGGQYLMKATYECGYKSGDDDPSSRDNRRPIIPDRLKLPAGFAGSFSLF